MQRTGYAFREARICAPTASPTRASRERPHPTVGLDWRDGRFEPRAPRERPHPTVGFDWRDRRFEPRTPRERPIPLLDLTGGIAVAIRGTGAGHLPARRCARSAPDRGGCRQDCEPPIWKTTCHTRICPRASFHVKRMWSELIPLIELMASFAACRNRNPYNAIHAGVGVQDPLATWTDRTPAPPRRLPDRSNRRASVHRQPPNGPHISSPTVRPPDQASART
jgi:hypothetical protein